MKRNVPLAVNVTLQPGETRDVKVEFFEPCYSKYLHIPNDVAGLLSLLVAHTPFDHYQYVGPIGCTVFSDGAEVDPFHAHGFLPGHEAHLTFENRSKLQVELHGALVVEVE